MSNLQKRKQEKNQEEVRKLSLQADNKVCMDCPLKNTPYVVSNFNTFVCTACSGVHRSFQFRVKGISMTTFNDEEIEKLKTGGNAKAARVWRARWNPKDYPMPNPTDEKALKDFIFKTYVEKKWYSEDGADNGSYSSHSPQQTHSTSQRGQQQPYQQPQQQHGFDSEFDSDFPVQPLQEVLNNVPPLQVGSNKRSSVSVSSVDRKTSFTQQQPKQTNNDILSFDTEFDAPAHTHTQQQPQGNKQTTVLDDSLFITPAKTGSALADELFGPSTGPSTPSMMGGNMMGGNMMGGNMFGNPNPMMGVNPMVQQMMMMMNLNPQQQQQFMMMNPQQQQQQYMMYQQAMQQQMMMQQQQRGGNPFMQQPQQQINPMQQQQQQMNPMQQQQMNPFMQQQQQQPQMMMMQQQQPIKQEPPKNDPFKSLDPFGGKGTGMPTTKSPQPQQQQSNPFGSNPTPTNNTSNTSSDWNPFL